MNRTLINSTEDDLLKSYEDEMRKFKERENVYEILKKLDVEDLPQNISTEAKQKIEKALRSARINDHLDINEGLTLFDLEDSSKIKLSTTEQKLIKNQIQKAIDQECKRRIDTRPLEMKLQKGQEEIFEIQEDYKKKIQQLEQLKMEEIKLSLEVLKVFLGDDQKLKVKAIEQELELLELRIKSQIDSLQSYEMSKTRYYEQAFEILATRVDQILKAQLEK